MQSLFLTLAHSNTLPKTYQGLEVVQQSSHQLKEPQPLHNFISFSIHLNCFLLFSIKRGSTRSDLEKNCHQSYLCFQYFIGTTIMNGFSFYIIILFLCGYFFIGFHKKVVCNLSRSHSCHLLHKRNISTTGTLGHQWSH